MKDELHAERKLYPIQKKEIDYFSDWVLKNKFLRAGRRLLALF